MTWLKIKKDNMPYNKSTQKKYGENPLQKRSGFKMGGYSYPGTSPMKQSWKAQKTNLTKEWEPKATSTEFTGDYTFDDAFATARKQGFKTFDWKGKSYHTKTKEEV